MALRVIVELNGRPIATARIENISGLAEISDYWWHTREDASSVSNQPETSLAGTIKGHRRAQSVWALVAAVANAALPNTAQQDEEG